MLVFVNCNISFVKKRLAPYDVVEQICEGSVPFDQLLWLLCLKTLGWVDVIKAILMRLVLQE